jgi:hypothetical protein
MGKKKKIKFPAYEGDPSWRGGDSTGGLSGRPVRVSSDYGYDFSPSSLPDYLSSGGQPTGLYDFGSIEDLASGYTPYPASSSPTSSSPTSSSPASSSRPAQPKLLETWDYRPAAYVRRGLTATTLGGGNSGGGSGTYRDRLALSNRGTSSGLSNRRTSSGRGSRMLLRPESWISSTGRTVYEKPVNTGPSWRRMMEGGMVRRYQAGGIMDAMAPPVEMEAGFAEESIGGREMEAGFAEESVGGREEAVMIFSEAAEALRGEHPNPNDALKRFVDAFGIDALEKLKATLQTGDGMSDSIPGNIDGVEDVALSEGEFIVPADAVSGIGNGSTDSGARRLMDMVENVRTARTGTPEQAPAIEPRQMGLGGLIRR